MIKKEIFEFLEDLKANNNREWFQDNKDIYQSLRTDFMHIVEMLIHEISQFDRSIAGLQPKDCIFRINRDIRFSKDKSPYKTNIGGFITPGGRNSGKAGYYIHVEPGASMLAGGIYMPPSPILKAIRTEIYENADEFKEILDQADFKQYFGGLTGEKLKSAPRGFPKDYEDLELLKYKHYTVLMEVKDNELQHPDFFTKALEVFEAMYPLNRFLNQVVSQL